MKSVKLGWPILMFPIVRAPSALHQQADRQPGREGDGVWLHQNEPYILCHPDISLCCCRLLRWLFPSTAPNIDWDGYVSFSTLRPR